MREGFLGTAKDTMLFFWLCKRYHIDAEKERVQLLRRLSAKKRLKYIRDGEAYLEGKRTLRITHKHECNPENYCRDHVRCLCMCWAEHKKETQ
jgi:hypothetical protein